MERGVLGRPFKTSRYKLDQGPCASTLWRGASWDVPSRHPSTTWTRDHVLCTLWRGASWDVPSRHPGTTWIRDHVLARCGEGRSGIVLERPFKTSRFNLDQGLCASTLWTGASWDNPSRHLGPGTMCYLPCGEGRFGIVLGRPFKTSRYNLTMC